MAPDVSSVDHEYGHELGLDDRYHEVFVYQGNQVRGDLDRVATLPMKLMPGVDDEYNMYSNMMSSPNANGGGQITQNQWSYVFNVQQERREVASFYVPFRQDGSYVSRSMNATVRGCVFTTSGAFRIMNDAHGCPAPIGAAGLSFPTFNYIIGNNGTPSFAPYPGNRAIGLWNNPANTQTMQSQIR